MRAFCHDGRQPHRPDVYMANSGVPDQLESLVFDMLEKKPDERVQTIPDFLERLRRVQLDDYW